MGSVGSVKAAAAAPTQQTVSGDYSLADMAKDSGFNRPEAYVDDLITGEGSTFDSQDDLRSWIEENRFEIVGETAGSSMTITDPSDVDKRRFQLSYSQPGEQVRVTSIKELSFEAAARDMDESQLRAYIKKNNLTSDYNQALNLRRGAPTHSAQMKVMRDMVSDHMIMQEARNRRKKK